MKTGTVEGAETKAEVVGRWATETGAAAGKTAAEEKAAEGAGAKVGAAEVAIEGAEAADV